MGLFTTSKSHASITAPLAKMVKDLKAYIQEQITKIQGLEKDKTFIEDQITESSIEIRKSENTAKKIGVLIGEDDDENSNEEVIEVVEDTTPPDEAA